MFLVTILSVSQWNIVIVIIVIIVIATYRQRYTKALILSIYCLQIHIALELRLFSHLLRSVQFYLQLTVAAAPAPVEAGVARLPPASVAVVPATAVAPLREAVAVAVAVVSAVVAPLPLAAVAAAVVPAAVAVATALVAAASAAVTA